MRSLAHLDLKESQKRVVELTREIAELQRELREEKKNVKFYQAEIVKSFTSMSAKELNQLVKLVVTGKVQFPKKSLKQLGTRYDEVRGK